MRLRTLIVDDEPIARQVLREELEQIGEVEIVGEAADGTAALAAIRLLFPDLIFLDLQMPGLSGFDVIKKLPSRGRIPMVVIVTAFSEHAINCLRRRCNRLPAEADQPGPARPGRRAGDQASRSPGRRRRAARERAGDRGVAALPARAENCCPER